MGRILNEVIHHSDRFTHRCDEKPAQIVTKNQKKEPGAKHKEKNSFLKMCNPAAIDRRPYQKIGDTEMIGVDGFDIKKVSIDDLICLIKIYLLRQIKSGKDLLFFFVQKGDFVVFFDVNWQFCIKFSMKLNQLMLQFFPLLFHTLSLPIQKMVLFRSVEYVGPQ